MDLKEAIFSRRAVRSFTAETVDEQVLRALIDAAIQAPSAVNAQPWAFCVVRDKTMLADISRRAKAHILATTPAGLLSHHFETTLNDSRFNIFYDAPALVVICSRNDNTWAVENCALAAQNLMLAARAAGLGTCWIGFAQGWLRTDEGKALLHLPEGWLPVAPIIVGHPNARPTPVPRKEPEIHWVGAQPSNVLA